MLFHLAGFGRDPCEAVMTLSPEDRRDREKVNEAARQAEQNRGER
jgi:hypothetical protein